MATSDGPLNVPNVTLALAIRSVLLPDAGIYSAILEAIYLQLYPDYESWGAGSVDLVSTWYYVDAAAPGGGDGSSVSPWTFDEGLAAPLQAGEGLRLRSGVYDFPATKYISTSWQGTAGAPIYIRADDMNSMPVLQGPAHPNLGKGLFADGVSYFGVYGIETVNVTVGCSFENTTSDHLTVEKSFLHDLVVSQGDNGAFFRVDRANKSVFRNNLLVNADVASRDLGNDGQAFETYSAQNILFENNTIENVWLGFYIKRPPTDYNQGHICRRNIFKNTRAAWYHIYGNSTGNQINHNNICAENLAIGDQGIYDFTPGLLDQCTELWLFNNTLIGNSISIDGHDDVRIFNNILDLPANASSQTLLVRPGEGVTGGSSTEVIECNYNCYPQGASVYVQDTGTNYLSLASWQGASNVSGSLNFPVGGPDADSFVADPLYADSANGDYSLAIGSPCIGTGKDGDNIGAYATQNSVIGRIA